MQILLSHGSRKSQIFFEICDPKPFNLDFEGLYFDIFLLYIWSCSFAGWGKYNFLYLEFKNAVKQCLKMVTFF